MKKVWIFLLIFNYQLTAGYDARIDIILPEIEQRIIKGDSYRKGCPVGLNDLRYLRMKHKNFEGEEQWGEMIIHKDVAKEVTEIFEALYQMDYPIRKMQLVSNYNGSDWNSIEADNTSAFNCRKATGSKKFSKHSYGKAIDINPIENPYVFRSGKSSHKGSAPYLKRIRTDETASQKAMLLPDDKAVKIFKTYGWKWGGEWKNVKDYQHFSK